MGWSYVVGEYLLHIYFHSFLFVPSLLLLPYNAHLVLCSASHDYLIMYAVHDRRQT